MWRKVSFGCCLVVLAACAPVNPIGVYAGNEPLPGGGERYVRVYLKPEGAVSLQAAYADRGVFAEGKWQHLPDNRVIVDLAGDNSERLVFLLAGSQLSAVAWQRPYWGKDGPGVLYKVR
jgi:hypothetical protein